MYEFSERAGAQISLLLLTWISLLGCSLMMGVASADWYLLLTPLAWIAGYACARRERIPYRFIALLMAAILGFNLIVGAPLLLHSALSVVVCRVLGALFSLSALSCATLAGVSWRLETPVQKVRHLVTNHHTEQEVVFGDFEGDEGTLAVEAGERAQESQQAASVHLAR